MFRILCFLAALAFSVDRVAAAGPQSLSGPLINTIGTGAARVAPGQISRVFLTLRNNTGAVYTGTLVGTLTGRGVATGTPQSLPVNNLAIGQSATFEMDFTPSASGDIRGYLVSVQALDGSNAVVDSAGTAVAYETTPYVTPRYCFAAHYVAGTQVAALVQALNAWHCNGLQMYDVAHRQATPLFGVEHAESWANLGALTINRQTLANYVGMSHRYKMFDFLFMDMGTADSGFLTSGEAVSPQWALYTSATTQNASTYARFPDPVGGPACYGGSGNFPSTWQSPFLVNLDPTNPAWQAYWATAASAFTSTFGIDGFNLDTLGQPQCPTYKFGGAAMVYNNALSSIYNAVKAATSAPMVIQDELQESILDILPNAHNLTFYLTEIHPNIGLPATYAQIATNINNGRLIRPGIGQVFMTYHNENYAQTTTSCSTFVGPDTCYFNMPGVLYENDLVIAAGAWPMDITDGSDGTIHLVSNIYVPTTSAQLAMTPALREAENDRRAFATAYEKLLRTDVLFDATHPLTCTSGATCATTGAAGSVFVVTVAHAQGFQIAHLLNYQQLTSVADASDTNATQPAPTTTGPIAIKMYYGGSVTGSNKLWLASPDINHGGAQSLTYTKGSDSGGNYVTATLPSLQYWDMLWLELDAMGAGNYASP